MLYLLRGSPAPGALAAPRLCQEVARWTKSTAPGSDRIASCRRKQSAAPGRTSLDSWQVLVRDRDPAARLCVDLLAAGHLDAVAATGELERGAAHWIAVP